MSENLTVIVVKQPLTTKRSYVILSPQLIITSNLPIISDFAKTHGNFVQQSRFFKFSSLFCLVFL